MLGQFCLGELLVSPPSNSGLPIIYQGFDKKSNETILIKLWERQYSVTDDDLEVIWRNEIRLLQRLSGYPGGKEYLVTMLDAGSDQNGFYLILKTNQLRPLSWHKKRESFQGIVDRQLMWKNMKRLAKGLGTLHNHGMIHRNLDESAVFTNNTPVPDYRLGGFEWSIRLSAIEPVKSGQQIKANGNEYFSFNNDWRSLGHLIAKILSIDVSKFSDSSIAKEYRQDLNIEEYLFLRNLIAPDKVNFERLNSDIILEKIDKLIISNVANQSDEITALYLTYDSGRQQHLWKHLESIDNIGSFRFLEKDLVAPKLLKIKQPAPRPYQYALLGDQLIYFLKKANGKDWTKATLDSISDNKNHLKHIHGEYIIPQGELRINSGSVFSGEPISLEWDKVVPTIEEESISNIKPNVRYEGFVLLHLIEVLHMLALTWPITVKSVSHKKNEGYLFSVQYDDNSREELRRLLGINQGVDKSVEQLEELLDKPQEDGLEGWQVTRESGRNVDNEPAQWHFVKAERKKGSVYFNFSGVEHFAKNQRLLLKPCGERSQDKQMQRRTELLSRLKDHAELTELLDSPLDAIRASHDPVPTFQPGLDDSKKKALNDIFSTLPIYLLQGPPGVGKTYLVTELINENFTVDPTTRILVTAQGHNAINHLMAEICDEIESWPEEKQPLIVRSRNKKGREVAGKFHIKNQAQVLLKGALESQLYQDAPKNIKENIQKLNQKIIGSDSDKRLPDTALESLLLRSANLVFSTTNSADLKSMLNASARFDWSIVEEAGRATGTELLAPLMLSHRRLLIGDPKQLPPFGEDKVRSLLSDPIRLEKAFDCGRHLLSKSHMELGIDDLMNRFSDPTHAKKLAEEVMKTFLLFESLHRDTFNKNSSLPVAGILNEQYRMHPVISDVVSKLFYKDTKISTATKTKENRLINQMPYKTLCEKRLPSTPIVFIDMPWKQDGKFEFGEKNPAYYNPKEIIAVTEALKLLHPSSSEAKPTSLSIITPYNEQVDRISQRINKLRSTHLEHLSGFDTGNKLVHTIDSFQGDESDIIIVSLVRNNERGWGKGLGILADARRMNVLLSRAKWKIIIVGSLKFLKTRFPKGKAIYQEDDLRFIKDLISLTYQKQATAKRSMKHNTAKDISVVPFSTLMNEKSK